MIELETGTVYVFQARVQDLRPDAHRLLAFLSEREQTRAKRFKFDQDRDRFTMAAGWMRRLLGRVLGVDPSHLAFTYGDHGKPALEGGPAFNLSHSGDHLLLGMAGAGRLGVDVEVVRPMADLEQLAARYFSEEEIRELRAFPTQERLRAFFRGWTRKEAFLKGLGRGLSVALHSFSVSLAAEAGQALKRADLNPDQDSDWAVLPVPVDAEVEAAVAWDHGIPSIVEGARLLL